MNSLTLSAWGLFSKWGFGDGDVISEWWWDTHDEDPPIDEHAILIDLVTHLLIPAIEAAGHQIEVETIETIHNPIRATALDGAPVPDDVVYGHQPPPAWTNDVYVEIQPATIRERLEGLSA